MNDHSSSDPALEAHLARREQALAAVRELLVESLKVQLPPERIELDAPLFGTGLGLDSVDAVELVVALETRLGLHLPEGTAGAWAFRTVGSLVELVLDPPPPPTEAPPVAAADELDHLSPGLRALRTAVALHESPEEGRAMQVLALRGEGARAALSWLVPSRLHLRDAQARQSVFLDEAGRPVADVLVCADDEDYVLLVEGLEREQALAHVARALASGPATEPCQVVDLRREHELFSLHGPWAWELAAEVLGPDLVALPYLNFFRMDEGLVFRAGTTGEFGYHLLVKRELAAGVRARLEATGPAFDLAPITEDELSLAALESWFFDPRHVPADATARELALGWRLALDRSYLGRTALDARGCTHRLVCVVASEPLEAGAPVTLGEREIGRVARAAESAARRQHVGAALVEVRLAHGGVDRYRAGGVPVLTVAPPLLDNRSLHVDPRRHSYRTRDEVRFGPIFRAPRATMAGTASGTRPEGGS
jgi:acyl carrier protein